MGENTFSVYKEAYKGIDRLGPKGFGEKAADVVNLAKRGEIGEKEFHSLLDILGSKYWDPQGRPYPDQ